MFNFLKNKIQQDSELENLFEIVQNADIVYARYDYDSILYTFSNAIVILFEDKHTGKYIKAYDQVNKDLKYDLLNHKNPIYFKVLKINEFESFKNKFTDKANQYRQNIAIQNESINIAEINLAINSDQFYFNLANEILDTKSNIVNYLAVSLVNVNPKNENGERFLDLLFENVWQKMRAYYGDTGLHNKLKQLQEQEK